MRLQRAREIRIIVSALIVSVLINMWEVCGMEDRYRRLIGQQMRILRSRHRIIEHSLLEIGIHSSQHFALMYLSNHTSAVSQVQLAELLNITPASVARTMKVLEAGGYIRRSDAVDDGRRNEITITDKGRYVVETSRRIFDRIDRNTFEGISEEELALLERIQDRILQNIDALQEKELK